MTRRLCQRATFCLLLATAASTSASAQLLGGHTYPITGTQNPPASFGNVGNAIAYLVSNGASGTGQVILEMRPSYTGAEAGPITIPPIAGLGASLGLTLRPAYGASVSTVVTGNATSGQTWAIRIAGSYITLDGQPGGLFGNGSWFIQSAGSSTPSEGRTSVLIDNSGGSVTGVTIRNCQLFAEMPSNLGGILMVSGAAGFTMSNILVEQNTISSAGTRPVGIQLTGAGNAGNSGVIVRQNAIGRVTYHAIELGGGFPGAQIYQNTVNIAVSTPTTNEFAAVYVNTSASQGAVIHSNNLLGPLISGASPGINGILLALGNTSGSPIRIYNNRVSYTGSADPAIPRWGIRDACTVPGCMFDIDYNSVSVGGSVTSGSAGSAAFRKEANTAVRLRNNIFLNSRTNSGGSGTHYAISINGTTNLVAIGHNDYFTSGTGGVLGTTNNTAGGNVTTLAAWNAAVPADAASINADPNYDPFFGDMTINPCRPGTVESKGIAIAGIDTDFQGQVRQGSAGYPGVGTAPEIGADERDLPGALAPNVLAHRVTTPVQGQNFAAAQPFNPSAYFGNSTASSATSVPVRFRIVGPSPSSAEVYNQFAVLASIGANSLLVFNFPSTSLTVAGTYTAYARSEAMPDIYSADNEVSLTFNVLPGLSGPYTVGDAQPSPFYGLSSAFSYLATFGALGPVTFNLADTVYTGGVALQVFPGAGPLNRLTIKPAPGVSTHIEGGSTFQASVYVQGARYITLDGSNNGTASRDMVVSAKVGGSSIANLWCTPSGPNGVQFCEFKNISFLGGPSNSVNIGVGLGGGAISVTSNGTGHNYNLVQNCLITGAGTGIYSAGASAGSKNRGNSFIGNTVDGSSSFPLTNVGALLRFEDSVVVDGGTFRNMTSSGSAYGISLGVQAGNPLALASDEVTNASLTRNRIGPLMSQTTLTGYAAVGILAGTAASGLTRIANNMVFQPNTGGSNSPMLAGIYAGGGAAQTRIQFNSISVAGPRLPTGSGPAFDVALDGADPNVELRDNILMNTMGGGGTRGYSIGVDYGTFAGLTSDRNLFQVTGSPSYIGVVGGFLNIGPGDQATLASWQAATGKDPTSLTGSPRFVDSTSDLHVSVAGPVVSPAADAGVTIAAVPLDLDGDTRTGSPDVGADEFATYPLSIVIVGDGSVNRSPNFASYNPGTVVQLDAVAGPTGSFSAWSGDTASLANPLALAMTGPRNVTATFVSAQLSVMDSSVVEGTGSGDSLRFRVVLSAPVSDTVRVTAQTADNTALATEDYQAATTQLVFPPGGPLSQLVAVAISHDNKREPDELMYLNLGAAQHASLADSQAAGTIVNDDAVPTLSVNDVTHFEGNGGTTSYVFVLQLSNPTYLGVTLNASTADGTAHVSDSDYSPLSAQPVSFPAATLIRTVTVLVNGDAAVEPDETFLLNLAGLSNATFADSQAQGTIRDDDGPPTLSVDDVSVTEGNSGTVLATFHVSLSRDPGVSVYVDVASEDGSATTADGDYVGSSVQQIKFTGMQLSQAVPVTVNGDTKGEPNEVFRMRLSNPLNAVIADSTGDGTILNDDETVPPQVALASPNGGEGWVIGQVRSIAWNATDNVGVTAVDLEYSTNSGVAWLPVAAGLANTGSFPWTVPNTPTAHARVRAIAVDAAQNAARDTSDADFLIGSPADVDAAQVPERNFLDAPSPNPFDGSLQIAYGLHSAGLVRLELFDIHGRRVRTLASEVERAGRRRMGWDGLDRDGTPLASGMYILRLEVGGDVFKRVVRRIR